MPGTLSPDVYLRGDTGALRQTDGTTDAAVNGWLGGVVYNNAAVSTAHSGTTTEALFDKSYSIPANTLVAGSVIKVKAWGIATATNSSDTVQFKLYIGGVTGTAILTVAATDATNADVFYMDATIIIRTIGATGTLVAAGISNVVPAATAVAAPVIQTLASTTIDTTAAQVIGVGCDWGSSSGSNSAILNGIVVEIY